MFFTEPIVLYVRLPGVGVVEALGLTVDETRLPAVPCSIEVVRM